MSFEIHVQRFKRGETAAFARLDVDEIFDTRMAAHADGEQFIELVYPTGSGGTLHIGRGPEIGSFSVMSPGVEDLFDDLFRLMRKVGAVVYWPDEKPSLVVAAEDARADLPESMIEALGPGLLVRSGRDIIAAIKREL